MIANRLTSAQIAALASKPDGAALLRRYRNALTPFALFEPRENVPEDYDQQTAFVEARNRFSICLGGTGSGKTQAAAYKTAKYIRDTPPHRERCPFWVIGNTYEQTCGVCWDEKLSTFIDKADILHIDWYRPNRNWPFAVTLRHPDNRSKPGWVIEFKSFEQGRQNMQGRSIGGYWLNEEVPLEIVREIQGRCREYDSPGWADFTPIDVVSPEWPDLYDNPPKGWEFFHLNVLRNDYLAPGWAEDYIASFPEEERETRRIGVFSSYSGQVFKEWRPAAHVVKRFDIPRDWQKIRGLDFGHNNPFACVWVAKDHDGRYYIYDEHYASGKLNLYHAAEINRREWNETLPWYGKTYSDHDAQERAELGALGIHCTLAVKSIGAGIRELRRLMMPGPDGKPRFYVFSHCKNSIREIRGLRWPEGTDTRNPKAEPLDKDNHTVDAIRYAVYSDILGHGTAPKPVRREWQQREGFPVNLKR